MANLESFVSSLLAATPILMFSNHSFTVNDATLLLRDMASDSAQKAANVIRPPEDQLAQIDHPAPDNVWHEKPEMNKEAVKSRMKTKTQQDGPAGAGQGASVEEVKGQAAEEAKTRGRELSEKTKEFLASKMPKERREQTIWRLKKMIVEIQGHSDCMH